MALDNYKSLPRVQLAHPIVSMDEPHVIFFLLCESYYAKVHGDRTGWLVMVDTKSKTMPSVYHYDKGCGSIIRLRTFFPSSISDYFNSSTCSSNGASLMSKSSMVSEPPPLHIRNGEQFTENASNSKATSREETILAALQEIPDLAREDMLKAYSIISRDTSGRLFRSLLGLPLSMRKDLLLMEIKTSEACSLCSACKANLQHS